MRRIEIDADDRICRLAQFEHRFCRPDHRAWEFLDGNLLDVMFFRIGSKLLPEGNRDLPLVIVGWRHEVRPGNGRDNPVRRYILGAASWQASHGNNLLDAELLCQIHASIHGFLVLSARFRGPERITRSVEGRDAHAALREFCLEIRQFLGIRQEFLRMAVLLSTPTASRHLNGIDAEGFYFIKHVRIREICEHVRANCELHDIHLLFFSLNR